MHPLHLPRSALKGSSCGHTKVEKTSRAMMGTGMADRIDLVAAYDG
jgi:hypothetical protein